MVLKSCALLLLLATVGHAVLPLPPYMKPCSLKDPDFNACVLQHGKDAIPEMIKGERKYGLPVLDPVEIIELVLPSDHFKLHLKNVKLTGMKNVDLKSVIYDLKHHDFIIEMVFPVLQIVSKYEMDGRILLLPISGKGDLNMTVDNVQVKTHADLNLAKIDGRDHLKFTNFQTQAEPKQVHLHFTNLFNGNKLLGDEMNELLNKEWRDAWRDFGPAVIEAANKIIDGMTQSFSETVPFDEWFPEKV
ncbi:hypothetical protein L9F63_005955 [Diploptera punctata]|uniref:Uncharacterized protein n=1 Tax=Diploptera punctata TaxID=6984 RepID=A0AAD8E5E8_DIPPU|nr:hypothetical protein L9F63_005955 [Diploptera punctata]